MRRIAMAILALSFVANASAQTNAAPVQGMASTVGLYVYPRSHQTSTQQLTDESQCYSDARSQTGYDPNATTTSTAKTDDKKGGDKPMAKGAMRGAVISGATGGDPAAGARRGAIIGGIKEKRQEKKETASETQANAKKAASQQTLDNFKRSLSACLDSRGYSVK